MNMIPAAPRSVSLNQGGAIPQLGFAVFQVKEDLIPEVLDTALAAGYRSIDIAAAWKNEAAAGRAVRSVLRETNCSSPRSCDAAADSRKHQHFRFRTGSGGHAPRHRHLVHDATSQMAPEVHALKARHIRQS